MTPSATRPPCVHRDRCLLCDAAALEVVVPYPPTPIADAYLRDAAASVAQPRYGLDLHQCRACGHVQLADVVDPELLFGSYTYETSVSAGLVAHFHAYAEAMVAFARPTPGALVVEIGSNDGSLLRAFRDRGLRVQGVDPARAIAEKATCAGLPTVPAFFGSRLAAELRGELGEAALVCANNVFAHSEALPEMADGVQLLLAPDGVFSFEVSYLPDIVERCLFDTVYHEHLCYHAVTPLVRFLGAHGLELIDFQPLATKGGSFRGIAQRAHGPRPTSPAVARQLAFEAAAGYTRPEPFRALSDRLQAAKRALHSTLTPLRAAGACVAGYGASATVTTLLHYFELHPFLDFLVDDNPLKHGTFAPGSAVPVLPAGALSERGATHAVVLAWAYTRPILQRQAAWRAAGGRFIVPLPTVEVL